MRSTILLVVALFATALCGAAQSLPSAELYGGYQYLRLNTGTSAVPSQNLAGWDTSLTVNLHHWFGVTGDFSGNYASGSASKGDLGLREYTFLFGPQVTVGVRRAKVFGRFMFGGAKGEVLDAGTGILGGKTASSTDFAWDIGGGADWKLSHHFWVRPVQIDYLQTRHPAGTLYANDSQNHFRYSAGIVFKF